MINVSETIQTMFETWFDKVSELLDRVPDEERAFNLFWMRMSPQDAAEVLEYNIE